MKDLKEIPSFEIGPDLKQIIAFARELELKLILVGGAVRDLYLSGHLGKDLDFEIGAGSKEAISDWKKHYSLFVKKLEENGFVSAKLPFSIVRLEKDEIKYEFSPPRIESFFNSLEHKNFDAIIDSSLDYIETYVRRDFTINAIGLNVTENPMRLVDPANGKNDLALKQLRPCGPDFYRDPVRYLRAVRFKVKLNLNYHSRLTYELSRMNLQSCSTHFLKNEAIASRNLSRFLSTLGETLKRNNTEIPDEWKQIPFHLELLPSKNFHEYIFTLSSVIGEQQLLSLATLFGMKQSFVSDLSSYQQKLNELMLALKSNKLEVDALPSPNDKFYLKLAQIHILFHKIAQKLESDELLKTTDSFKKLPQFLQKVIQSKMVGGEHFLEMSQTKVLDDDEKRSYRFYAHMSEVLFGKQNR